MKITIHYKSDTSSFPFCAYTTNGGVYTPAWSDKSFKDAKRKLLLKCAPVPPIPPESEEVTL